MKFVTLEEAKEKLAGDSVIKNKLLDYAYEDNTTMKEVLRTLEEVNCAGCSSPAPIYNHDMAKELANSWMEVNDALEEYHDAIGEYYALQDNILTALWFTYEWYANELAASLNALTEEE